MTNAQPDQHCFSKQHGWRVTSSVETRVQALAQPLVAVVQSLALKVFMAKQTFPIEEPPQNKGSSYVE